MTTVTSFVFVFAFAFAFAFVFVFVCVCVCVCFETWVISLRVIISFLEMKFWCYLKVVGVLWG